MAAHARKATIRGVKRNLYEYLLLLGVPGDGHALQPLTLRGVNRSVAPFHEKDAPMVTVLAEHIADKPTIAIPKLNLLQAFAFPRGHEPRIEAVQPRSFFHNFVLTLSDGERLYGHCVTIYHPTARTAVARPAGDDDLAGGGDAVDGPQAAMASGSGSDLSWGSSGSARPSLAGADGISYTPRCLCVLSFWPIYCTFVKLFYSFVSWHRLTILDEAICKQIADSLAAAAESVENHEGVMPLEGGSSLRFRLPLSATQSALPEIDPYPLFSQLDSQRIVQFVAALLGERAVLVVCDRPYEMVQAIETLLVLLLPFQWPHLFIPCLPPPLFFPDKLLAYAASNTPFLLGVHRESLQRLSPIPAGFVVVDLDANAVITKSEPPKLPRAFEARLLSLLGEYGDLYNFLTPDTSFLSSASGAKGSHHHQPPQAAVVGKSGGGGGGSSSSNSSSTSNSGNGGLSPSGSSSPQSQLRKPTSDSPSMQLARRVSSRGNILQITDGLELEEPLYEGPDPFLAQTIAFGRLRNGGIGELLFAPVAVGLQRGSPLASLPAEVLHRVLSFLGARDLCRLSQTCKELLPVLEMFFDRDAFLAESAVADLQWCAGFCQSWIFADFVTGRLLLPADDSFDVKVRGRLEDYLSQLNEFQTLTATGELIKRGHRRKNWKKRLFELKEMELKYYNPKGVNKKGLKKKPKGAVLLTAADTFLWIPRLNIDSHVVASAAAAAAAASAATAAAAATATTTTTTTTSAAAPLAASTSSSPASSASTPSSSPTTSGSLPPLVPAAAQPLAGSASSLPDPRSTTMQWPSPFPLVLRQPNGAKPYSLEMCAETSEERRKWILFFRARGLMALKSSQMFDFRHHETATSPLAKWLTALLEQQSQRLGYHFTLFLFEKR